jgi:hypothetical protein
MDCKEQRMFHQSHWMTVFQTTREDEARLIAAALETSGIMARLHPAEMASPATECDEFTVLVDTRDYERAQKVLRPGEMKIRASDSLTTPPVALLSL